MGIRSSAMKLFLSDGDQTLEQANKINLGGFGISVSGGAQNLPRQDPEHVLQITPNMRRRLD